MGNCFLDILVFKVIKPKFVENDFLCVQHKDTLFFVCLSKKFIISFISIDFFPSTLFYQNLSWTLYLKCIQWIDL